MAAVVLIFRSPRAPYARTSKSLLSRRRSVKAIPGSATAAAPSPSSPLRFIHTLLDSWSLLKDCAVTIGLSPEPLRLYYGLRREVPRGHLLESAGQEQKRPRR